MFLDRLGAAEQAARVAARAVTVADAGGFHLHPTPRSAREIRHPSRSGFRAERPLQSAATGRASGSRALSRGFAWIATALAVFVGMPPDARSAPPEAAAGTATGVERGQGAEVADPEEPWLVLPKRFREGWRDFGTLYADPTNPYVQKFSVFGRLHYQYGVVTGESPEGHFHYDNDELRRLRLGIGSDFLNVFDLYAEAELSDDDRPSGGDFGLRFQQMWQLKLHADLKKAFGLEGIDGLELGIGSREIHMSHEWVTSSKRIKTVERSAIANKIWPFNSDFANPTGAWLTLEIAPFTWTFGAFGTTQAQFWAPPGEDGMLYYSNLVWDACRGPDGQDTDIRLTSFYQDVSDDDEVLAAGLEWANALSLQHAHGRWKLHVEGIVGDNGDQSNGDREGLFWALVGMPSYWIARDSLEAVVKFQYQAAEEDQGIRLNSRYVRREGSKDGIPSLANGRGDEHYSVYLGLNKLFSGHQHKVMLGLEYDHLQRDDARIFDGWSFLMAYRMYF